MFRNVKNSRKQGDVGLGKAISYFCWLGYTVSVPLTDSQDYDLVVEINGVLKKVQVKTVWHKVNSSYYVHLATQGGNGPNNKKHCSTLVYDLLFILTECDDIYIIPKEVIGNKNSISLGKKRNIYKQKWAASDNESTSVLHSERQGLTPWQSTT